MRINSSLFVSLFLLFSVSATAQFDLSSFEVQEDKTYRVVESVEIYAGSVELVEHTGNGKFYLQADKVRWTIVLPQDDRTLQGGIVGAVSINGEKCPVWQMASGDYVAVVRSTKSGKPYLKKVKIDAEQ